MWWFLAVHIDDQAIKSLRAWCLKTFSDEKELEIVGIATIDDELANAEYISRCDYLAKAPGGTNNFNYANIHLITEVSGAGCDIVGVELKRCQ